VIVTLGGSRLNVRLPVSPTAKLSALGLTLMPASGTLVAVTVTAQVTSWPPSAVLTVMVAVPAVAPGITAAVRPLLETVAMDVSLLLHVTA
jgi:uncharacterized membrane protein